MISCFLSIVNPWGWRAVRFGPAVPLKRPHLSALAANETGLPQFVRDCPVAQKYLRLLAPLDWANFPERDEHRPWPGPKPHPRAPYVAAYLVKLIKVTIPTELLKELDATIPVEQRDQFFSELLERELRRRNLQRAWDQAAGAWSDEDHPELKTDEDIERYIRNLRDRDVPRSWDEIIVESQDD